MTSAVLETTAREIIDAAFLDSGIHEPDETLVPEDTATGLARLNSMTKSWQAQGNHLWSQTEGIVFLTVGQESFKLGPTGDFATREDDFIDTTTTADLIAGDVNIPVVSTTGMLGAPNLITIDPISLQFWTDGNSGVTSVVSGELVLTNGAATAGFSEFSLTCTVGDTYRTRNGYTPGTSAGATFSIIDPVTAVVLDTETVTVTSIVDLTFVATQEIMTLRFANVSTTDTEDSNLTSLEQINKEDGDFIGIRQDDNTRHWTKIVEVVDATNLTINIGVVAPSPSGFTVFTFSELIDRPMSVYYPRSETIGFDNTVSITMWTRNQYMRQTNKKTQGTTTQIYYSPQLREGELFVWQTAIDADQIVRFTFNRPLQVSTDQLDNPDFPSEWFDALKWNLARQLLPGYSVPPTTIQVVMENAAESLDIALSFDEEMGSLFMQPNYSVGQRRR